MRVKSYFTVRELSVRSALSELYGLVALGGEVLHRRLDFPDPWEHRDNLGNAWLQQHLLNVPNATEPGYSIAYNLQMPWLQPGFDWDFALHVRGDSRWVTHLLPYTVYVTLHHDETARSVFESIFSTGELVYRGFALGGDERRHLPAR